ncbi:MAG: hypothetical protein A2915_01125 [Candidatus Yanofskybacteria bacterium RIFCSPLOWO2_01_FULL_41_34]|nr:MAG: hypothetical protein A2915_01125 [Candidatus Yanofskybacteria bacterium RIFCSPLOWO2_01_FULL_41_34]
MSALIQADIFFFITSIAVVIFTILLSIALYYLIGALKNFKELTKTLRTKLDKAGDEVEELKHKVSQSLVFNLLFAKKPSTKKTRTIKK